MSTSRFACLLIAGAALSGCLRETVQTQVDRRPMGRFTGPPVAGTSPRLHVVLHTAGGELSAEAMFVGSCATFDVVEERRVEYVKNEVGVFPVVMTVIATGIAMSVYVYPEIEPQESALIGTAVLATGGAFYGSAKALETESVRQPPARPAHVLGPPTPCVVRPVASERMTVIGTGKTLHAATDNLGRATFTDTAPAPYRVFFGRREADVVEVRP